MSSQYEPSEQEEAVDRLDPIEMLESDQVASSEAGQEPEEGELGEGTTGTAEGPGYIGESAADDAANAALAAEQPVQSAPVAVAADDDDPVAAFRRELESLPGDWYVLHTYAGYESRVKANLEQRIQSLNMEDYIFQIEVPTEEVIQIKGGKQQIVQQKKYPGYVYVRMDLTDESWAAVRNTPNVTGFVGLTNKPSPLRMDEIVRILRSGPGEEEGRGAEGSGVRDRRVGHRHGRPVRDPAGDDQRDQPRRPAPEGAGVDLRPGDAGRAAVQPGREDLSDTVRAASAPAAHQTSVPSTTVKEGL